MTDSFGQNYPPNDGEKITFLCRRSRTNRTISIVGSCSNILALVRWSNRQCLGRMPGGLMVSMRRHFMLEKNRGDGRSPYKLRNSPWQVRAFHAGMIRADSRSRSEILTAFLRRRGRRMVATSPLSGKTVRVPFIPAVLVPVAHGTGLFYASMVSGTGGKAGEAEGRGRKI